MVLYFKVTVSISVSMCTDLPVVCMKENSPHLFGLLSLFQKNLISVPPRILGSISKQKVPLSIALKHSIHRRSASMALERPFYTMDHKNVSESKTKVSYKLQP